MTDPKISFCIPAYNGARFLPRLIERLAAFPRHSFEIILLDDGSTDDTVAVATRLAGSYEMLRVHRQPANVGFMRNFAAACHLARGKYIYPISQDDLPVIESLANGVDRMDRTPSASVLFGNSSFFGDDDEIDFSVPPEPSTGVAEGQVGQHELHRLFQSYFYELEYGIMRREIFQRFYFNEGHVLPVGWYLVGTLGKRGDILLSGEVLLYKRSHGAALTSSLGEPWFQELARRDLESFLLMMDGLPAADRLQLLFQKQMSLYLHTLLSVTRKGRPALGQFIINRLRGYGYWLDEQTPVEEASFLLATCERVLMFLKAFPALKEVAVERVVREHPAFTQIEAFLPPNLFTTYDRQDLIALPDAQDRFVLLNDSASLAERAAKTDCDPSRQRAFIDFQTSLMPGA